MCLPELVHRLVEADAVSERADISLSCSDPVVRHD